MKKFFTLFLLLILIYIKGIGQTTILLDPAGAGGFESNTTFSGNGWSTAQPGNTNQWQVGTVAGVQGGSRAAYVGSTTAYTGTSNTSVQHFYRDIAIPAGAKDVQFSFYYKQPTVDNTRDIFYVFTTTTANTPVSGTVPSTGYTQQYTNTATAYSTYQLVGPIDLTSYAGTTVRLVFTFKSSNGTTAINSNPAVDNISMSYTTPPTITSFSPTSGCANSGTVVITGTNLSDIRSVTIGGTPVSSFTINSATQVTASIGNGTTGQVAVSNLGGTATSTATYTVNPLPGTVGTITGSAAVCPGSAVNYTVPDATDATSYTWTMPTGWTITAGQGTKSITATTGSAGQNGFVTVTASNACGSSGGITQTLDITPLSVANNSGYVDSLTNTKTNGDVWVASSVAIDNASTRRGYLKFPLSGIPPNATINSSVLSLTNYTTNPLSALVNTVRALGNNDPATTTGTALSAAILNGAIYSSSTWDTTGTINLSLNSTATADIQSRLSSPAYLALGLVRGQGSSVYKFYGYGNGANSPTLAVTYSSPRNLAVTVNTITAISAQPSPATQTLCQNTAATALSVSATGTNLTYQWYSNTTNSNNGGTLISGATASTYTPSTSNANTTYYYVVVSGSCGTVTSNVAAVVVNPATAITSQPSATGQTVCLNSTATALSVTATGTGVLTYQWYSNTTNSNSGGTLISGATSSSYTPLTTTAGTTYYYVVVTGSCSPTSVTSTASGAIIINPATKINTSPAGATYCQNAAANALSVSATGINLSYQWFSNTTNSTTGGTAVGTNSNTYTPVTTAAGTLYYYVVVTGSCGTLTSATAAVAVNATTTITAQPSPATQTICQNSAATPLSVSATGTNLTYQWYSNTANNNSGGTLISGSAASTYTPSTTTVGTTYYYVVVNGSCGSVTSNTTTVIVNAATAIPVQPSTATQTVCQNATATALSVTATGTGTLTYQWYSNTTNGNSGGTLINGATSSLYTPVTTAAGTLYYYVIVSGSCSPTSVTSAVSGAITVTPATVINANPSGATYCQNATATALSVSATGTGTLTYQWFSNTINSTSGGTAIGTNSSTYTPSTTAPGTLYYYVVVNGSCGSVTSTVAAVTVNTPTAISAQPSPATQTICQNATATTLSVTATGTGTLTYQWFSNSANSSSGGTSISGATSASYTPPTTVAGTIYYYVLITGTCGTATSNTAAVIVNAATAITTQPLAAGQTVCPNTTATALSVNATGTGTLTYQWFSNTTNSNSNGTLVSGATSSSFTPSTTVSGTTYYYVVVTGSCGTAISNTSAVNVSTPVSISGQPLTTQTVCQNAAVTNLSVTASGTGISYQWFRNTTNTNSGGTLISGAISSSFTPSTTTAGSTYYYVVVTGSCNTVASNTSGVIVNAATAITTQPSTAGQTLCQNSAATALSVNATGTGLTYQWYSNTTNSNSGGTLISSATSSLYTPVTTTVGTTYYYVIISGSCSPASVTSAVSGAVTVTPATAINTNPAGATYCQNATANALSVTATGTGTLTYQWFSNTTNSTTGGTPIGTNSSNYIPVTTAAGTLYYYVVVTGSCGTATSSPVAVITNPATTITSQPSQATQTICQNATATTLSVTATGTGTLIYQWFSNSTNSSNGGTLISGATASTYKPSTSITGTTYYYVVVSGNCGTATSVATAVTTNAATVISSQPLSTQVVCQNTAATALAVAATGTNVSYQWFSNTTNNTSGGTLINGATSSSYMPATTNAGTNYYYVVITGTCGTATSNTAAVVVNAATVIAAQPSPTTQSLCQNAVAALTVSATGTNLSYQWYKNTVNSNNGGTLINSATAPSFTPPTLVTGTSYYYIVVTGSCGTVTSNTAAVTVTPATVIIAQPSAAGQTFCEGVTPAALSITATGTGTLSYQWYSNTTSSNNNGTLINGATASSYIPTTSIAGTAYYYVVVSSSCGTVTSNVATVTVNQKSGDPVSATASAPAVCTGSSTILTLNGGGGGTNAIIKWYSGSCGGTLVGTGNNLLVSPATTTTYYGRYEDGAPCAYLSACAVVTVTVNNLPVVAPITGPVYVAQGKNISLQDSTTGGTWSVSNTAYATISSTTANPVTVYGVLAGSAPVVTYTITNPATQCTNSVNTTIHVYNPLSAHYYSNQDGRFSNKVIWNIDRMDGNGEVLADDVPGNDDKITVRHNVVLNQDYNGTAAATFEITGHQENGKMVAGKLIISPNKYFSSAGSVDFGDNPVLVRSDATGTGAIGAITNSNGAIANATHVTVERYFGSAENPTGKRAWQLITAPVTGVTINNSWQEGMVSNTDAPSVGNPKYGTIITGRAQQTAGNAYNHGYDFWGAIANRSPSILYYKPAPVAGTWDTLPGIGLKNLNIESYPAYLLFVRGNRSVLDTGFGVTTLRATGTLKQGKQVIPVPRSSTQVATLVGNPYASPIDFEQVYKNSNTTGILHQFKIWNSNLGKYGAYQLIDGSGTHYTIVPSPFTDTPVDNDSARFIPAGVGFFVQPAADSDGTLTIDEAAKAPTQTNLINPFRQSNYSDKKLYVNLNLKNDDSTAILADGVLARFNDVYTADINTNDVVKQSNMYENLGIMSSNTNLMMEAKPNIVRNDTLQLKLWNTTKRAYQLQLKAEGFDSLTTLHAWLEDSYLNTKQAINLNGAVTTIAFAVTTESASYKSDRFRVTFRNEAVVLPLTLTSIKAAIQNGGVSIKWAVANEVNMQDYVVERSVDGGKTYSRLAIIAAKNSINAGTIQYNSFDALPQAGDNLYRIKMEGKDGAVTYSNIVIATMGEDKKAMQITVYPNPVTEGKLNLQLKNLAPGAYSINLYNAGGQNVYQKRIIISQPYSTQSEQLLLSNTLAQGNYEMRIANENGTVLKNTNVMIVR